MSTSDCSLNENLRILPSKCLFLVLFSYLENPLQKVFLLVHKQSQSSQASRDLRFNKGLPSTRRLIHLVHSATSQPHPVTVPPLPIHYLRAHETPKTRLYEHGPPTHDPAQQPTQPSTQLITFSPTLPTKINYYL